MIRELTYVIFTLILMMITDDLYAGSVLPSCGYELTSEHSLEAVTRLGTNYRDAHGDSKTQLHDLSCAMEQWQVKDGDMGSTVSDTFLNMVKSDPQPFFDFMAIHQKAFDEWLTQIDVLSFVWYLPPPSPMDRKRLELISILSKARIHGSTQLALRDRLVQGLRGMKPSQVE